MDEVSGASSSVSTPGRSALEFLEAPSDLVPRVYEGGLKTWEASLDLVQYLDALGFPDEALRGKRILEVSQSLSTSYPFLHLRVADWMWNCSPFLISTSPPSHNPSGESRPSTNSHTPARL